MSQTADVIIVLDESGSMETMGKEPVQAMNTFIKEQQKVEGDSRVSLYTFSNESRKRIDNILLSEFKEFSEYTPDGGTALYDCVSLAIREKMQTERIRNVVLVIITDGMDNSSQTCSRKQMKEMIQKQEQDHNWQVIFLAANQDAVLSGTGIGANFTRCANYRQQPGELIRTVSQMGEHVSIFRQSSRMSTRPSAIDFSENES